MRSEISQFAERVAEEFWRAFAGHRYDAAAALLDNRVSWFGEVIGRTAWQERATRAHQDAQLTVAWVATVSPSVHAAIPPALAQSIFKIALADNDLVYLFECDRDGRVVTVGTVVRVMPGAPPLLVAVFDPRPLREFCLSRLARAA